MNDKLPSSSLGARGAHAERLRGALMRTLLLIVAAVVLFYLYEASLIYGIAYPLGVLDPPWWESMFLSRGNAALSWMALHHTVAVLLVSLPFACVLQMLYGRHSVTVAFAMTLLAFFMYGPGDLSSFAHDPLRLKVVTILDLLKLIGTLPLLTWAVTKLPTNYRIERRLNHESPSSSVRARGAHAER